MIISPQMKHRLGELAGASATKMGDILILTSAAAWFASSAAQIVGIALNKNYTKEQKKFMISQEAADAVTNILLYVGVTKSLTSLTEHMVKTGKLTPRSIANFIRNQGLSARRGKFDFDVTKIPGFEKAGLKPTYDAFKCFTDATSATIGGIISSNIITPIVRNHFASKRQNSYKEKKKLATLNDKTNNTLNTYPTPRHSFDAYRSRVLSL